MLEADLNDHLHIDFATAGPEQMFLLNCPQWLQSFSQVLQLI